MDLAQTILFSKSAPPPDCETNPVKQEEKPAQTVVYSDIPVPVKDAGSAALARLDAISSLVKHEATQDHRQPNRESSVRGANEGSEESLDDYMKLFMERLTGKKAEPAAPAQPVQSVPTIKSVPVAESPVEARQPTRAPECSESLSRMRDLANSNSRNAIDVHRCRRLSSNVLASFLPAAAASLTSSGMTVAGAMTGSAWWYAGSAALLVVALVLAWRCWSISRKLFQAASQVRSYAADADWHDMKPSVCEGDSAGIVNHTS